MSTAKTTAKTKTAASKPAAKPAATETVAAPVIPGMPNFEAFKVPEISFGDTNMFDLSKFDMKNFDMQNFEVPAMVRDMAEKAVSQSKDGYAKAKAAAEDSFDMVEETLETVRETSLEVQQKAMDNAKASTDAVYDFFKDMFGVKSVSEAVELQTSFARQQFEMLSAQTKDMSELAGKAATESFKPAKDAAEKVMKTA
uniref:phasin n=1 Tax=Pararhizobium sp. IMCC3301 TaxID=3067904 RepID=UPI0027404DCF|nr:phasin [Pararhizobium sp. IMCC3301]